MRRLLLGLLGAGLLLGALALWLGYDVQRYAQTPVPLSTARLVDIAHGTTLRAALSQLAELSVISRPRALYWYARATGRTGVRAGQYRIDVGDTPLVILKKLAEGRVRTEQLSIIEGYNRWQAKDAIVAGGWMSAAEFDRLCDDKAFLAKHAIPGPTCEGYLFPETYNFARGLPPAALFAEFFKMSRKVFAQVTASGRGPLSLGMREFFTLASIVEKETAAPKERPHIACLFYNRLRSKPPWRLQTDPTVIYAATLADPHFDGNIKAWHLRELMSPYNTYTSDGLPPGPIASPSRASLEAVAHPANCKDFFFVSKNNGEHVFCETLTCHEAAVEKWQRQYFRNKHRR